MDPNTQDKENNGSISHNIIHKRRESLGRGILKPLNRADDNKTVAVMQIPLRDSQQDASSKQGKKDNKRRVSFAPDATIHTFMFGPQRKEERRRETIAFAPSSSQGGSLGSDLSIPIQSDANDRALEGDKLEYDSSDVEMEDDSHVYSSPNRVSSGPRFTVLDDDDDDDDMGEQSMNMSLTQGYTGNEDNTMELTKPLGYIQQIIPQGSDNSGSVFDQNIQEPHTTEEQHTTEEPNKSNENPSRPFGSITFKMFESVATEDEEEEIEQEMELTQPFSKVGLSENGAPISSQGDDIQNNSQQDDMGETTMDITSIAEGNTDMITMHNTQVNRELDAAAKYEAPIDDGNDDGNEYDQTEATMDVTKLASVHPPVPHTHRFSSPNVHAQDRLSSPRKSRATTPSKSLRLHTSEMGSPMSSKRKSRNDDHTTLNLRERLNSLTPRKRRKSSADRRISSQFNKGNTLFPITGTQYSSQEEPRSNFTPLRSKNISKKSIEVAGYSHPPAEKVPLASSHEQENEEADDQEFKPVPLKQFLTDLSIEFFDNLNINDELTLTFNENFDPSEISEIDCLLAKTSQVPWLELYIFCCTALQQNMAELKKLFDNLNDEFYEENPPLVRDYYQCSSLLQQKKMSDHLLFMKTLSDKEAEKSWLTWRGKILDEQNIRLTLNLETLQKDSSKLASTLEEVTKLEKTIDNEFLDIGGQLEEFSKQNEIIQASANEEVMSVREKLFEALETSSSRAQSLEQLNLQLQKCSENVVIFDSLEKEVQEKRSFIDINGRDPQSRLGALKKSFAAIQSVSGISLVKLDGQQLTISLSEGLITASVDLSKYDESYSTVIKVSPKLPRLTQTYVKKFLGMQKFQNFTEKLNKVINIVNYLNWLNDELYYLGLACPTEIKMNDTLNIRIKEVNKMQGYKAFIEIAFTENALFEHSKPTSVTANVIYGPQELNADTLLNNWKSKTLKDSWIQNFETLKLLR